MRKTRQLTIDVSEDYFERLDAIASSVNRSVDEIAEEALAVYLDAHVWQEAEIQRGLNAVNNGAVPVDHDRVVKWLESWDTENELPRPE
jgi:predicted transcriptional regulator